MSCLNRVIISGAALSFQHKEFYHAVQMTFYSIASKYNMPLEAHIAVIDVDRHVMGE